MDKFQPVANLNAKHFFFIEKLFANCLAAVAKFSGKFSEFVVVLRIFKIIGGSFKQYNGTKFTML